MKNALDTNQQDNKDKKALTIAALFLVLGLLVAWLAKAVLKIEGDATFVSLMLFPLLIYLILSGKLEEFKGPGGWEAKFTKAANETISAASEKIELSTEDMQIIQKESIRYLERKKQELNEAQPIIMTMELGKRDYYRRMVVLNYLETLSQFRNFKFVVFIDKEKRFVAYMPSWALKGVLKLDELGDNFIWLVNEGDRQRLLLFPGLVKETINTQSTNVEALREMMKQNVEALVVIDENYHLKGVVEREQILSRMMLSLT